MELQMFAIYDELSEEFNPPFLMKNEKLALKSYQEFIEKNKEYKKENKKLYRLPYLYDTDTAEIIDDEKLDDNKELKVDG